MTHCFNAGCFRGTPSWHGTEIATGGVFDGQVSIGEQMQKSEMDYEVIVSPTYYKWSDNFIAVEDQYHVIIPPMPWNDHQPESIRVIGNRYEVLQNNRIANLFEPLQQYYPLEGMGVLKNGRIVFIELRMEPFDVGGHPNEKHENYLLFSNDHTKKSAFFGETTVRVVCNNTYTIALAGDLTTIPHSTDVMAEMDFRATVMTNVIEARFNNKAILDHLFTTHIDSDIIREVVEATFPEPKLPRAKRVYDSADAMGLNHGQPAITNMAQQANTRMERWQKTLDRQQSLRLDIVDAYNRFNDEQPYAGGTAYALWQATTEVVNHSQKFTGAADKNMISLLFGQKASMLNSAWDIVRNL